MTKRKFGDNSEKKAAKKVKGKAIKGSGCLWYDKGDYSTENIIFQNKATKNDSYQLKIAEFDKAKKDALTKNKDFVFSIQLQDQWIYCFERVMIDEILEKELKLTPITINKCLKVDADMNYLINDKYVVINEYLFLNTVAKKII